MPIQVNCPKCGKQYTLKDESRGKPVRCKSCQTIFPAELSPPEPEVAAEIVEEPKPAPEPSPKQKRKGKPASKMPKMSPGLTIFSCCGGVSLIGYAAFGRGKAGGGGSGASLDGKYVVESAYLAGTELPKDRLASMFSDYVIHDNIFSYKAQGTNFSGAMTLNPSANPPTMDFYADGKTTYWIYKLEGDKLTMCMGGLEKESRPKDFNPKSAAIIMVLKRQ